MDSKIIVTTKDELIALINDAVNEATLKVMNRVQETPSSETLDETELCKRFGITRQTSRAWEKAGLQCYRPTGRRKYYMLNEIINFLKQTNREEKVNKHIQKRKKS